MNVCFRTHRTGRVWFDPEFVLVEQLKLNP